MADETQIALAVMQIAANQPNHVATFPRCKREIPNLVNLSAQNQSPSDKRPGEPMWHQILRNIRSHYKQDGNFIANGFLESVPKVGYRITRKGLKHLNQ